MLDQASSVKFAYNSNDCIIDMCLLYLTISTVLDYRRSIIMWCDLVLCIFFGDNQKKCTVKS